MNEKLHGLRLCWFANRNSLICFFFFLFDFELFVLLLMGKIRILFFFLLKKKTTWIFWYLFNWKKRDGIDQVGWLSMIDENARLLLNYTSKSNIK